MDASKKLLQTLPYAVTLSLAKDATPHGAIRNQAYLRKFRSSRRDDALKINYNNVQRTNAYNFHKQTDSDPFGVKYDFCSIMHYGNTGTHMT